MPQQMLQLRFSGTDNLHFGHGLKLDFFMHSIDWEFPYEFFIDGEIYIANIIRFVYGSNVMHFSQYNKCTVLYLLLFFK